MHAQNIPPAPVVLVVVETVVVAVVVVPVGAGVGGSVVKVVIVAPIDVDDIDSKKILALNLKNLYDSRYDTTFHHKYSVEIWTIIMSSTRVTQHPSGLRLLTFNQT